MPGARLGRDDVLDTGDRAVFAHRAEWEGSTIVAVHSFAEPPRSVELEIGPADAVVDLFGPDELRRPTAA